DGEVGGGAALGHGDAAGHGGEGGIAALEGDGVTACGSSAVEEDAPGAVEATGDGGRQERHARYPCLIGSQVHAAAAEAGAARQVDEEGVGRVHREGRRGDHRVVARVDAGRAGPQAQVAVVVVVGAPCSVGAGGRGADEEGIGSEVAVGVRGGVGEV